MSVHGEKPSAEYAKTRKESLESEFGQALGIYGSKGVSLKYRFGPFLALYRASTISLQVLKLAFYQIFVKDLKKRAITFRRTLIKLGPFYVKLGQALSTRPDILPSVYCQELAKLQDQLPAFPRHVAIKSIESQFGVPISEIFVGFSSHPVAAASLGQVYKAYLHSGKLVAVKVQRPGMMYTLTLDALLFHMIGGQLKRFARAHKDLLVAVNEMVRHMFDEVDYMLEGRNAERFASLYGCNAVGRLNTVENKEAYCIKVPKIHWGLTRKAVLTMEWIDGIKLTDEMSLRTASLDRRKLVDQGLYCSLRQLLEIGYFHADPHPGNLVATDNGSLAYFDFGMMGDIPRHYRVGLIRMLVHFINRDSLGLANDFLSLGFIPEGVDMQSVSNALQASFNDESRQTQDFQSIMLQLYDIMYEFNFSLPPDYALVVRALGSLEGTAKVLDPEFSVVESAYPFVVGRLLADTCPDMRSILRELLIHSNGSIRWHRLEHLMAAISAEASESAGQNSKRTSPPYSVEWISFDMLSVVTATEDLLNFILSDKGRRVQVFLLRDIIKAADSILQDDLGCKVGNGFWHLHKAVMAAPEAWMAMAMRVVAKPEARKFIKDVISALTTHFHRKFSRVSWLHFSKFLHQMSKCLCTYF